MSKLVEQAPQSFRGRLFQKDNARPKENRILVLKTGLVSFFGHRNPVREIIDGLTPGTELLLYREPDNFADAWAVRVYFTEEHWLGYVPRFKNETIARLMDAGKKLIAVVDSVEEYEQMDPHERERTLKPLTEDMQHPFSVYLIEEE